jgi:hypothetical protein
MMRALVLAALLIIMNACRSAAQDLVTTASATTQCGAELAGSEFRDTLHDLEATGGVEAVWPDYRLGNHDILFEWQGDAKGCVAHWSKGRIIAATQTTRPIALSTPMFGFLVTELGQASLNDRWGGFLTGEVPPQMLDSLRSVGAQTALVLLFNMERVDATFGAQSAQERRFTRNYLLHHESAHVNLWLPHVVQQTARYPWPIWSKQSGKQELVTRCYGAASLKGTFENERAALAESVRAAFAGDVVNARSAAAAFIGLRQQRYALLERESVRLGKDATLSCPDGEAVWELDEGGADFIAMSTLQSVKLWEREEILERIFQGTSVEPYYHFGAAQLLVLRLLLPEKMDGILREIVGSKNPSDGIHGQFVRNLALLPSE